MHARAFKLSPSTQYTMILSLVLVASTGIIMCLPIAVWWRCLLCFAIAIYSWSLFQKEILLLRPHSIIEIQHKEKNSWQIQTRQQNYAVTLLGDSVVTRRVCVLRFQASPGRSVYSCVIFPDSLNQASYRDLLVALHS